MTAYPGLKFVYNGADSEGIYVEIDDEKNYFGPRMEAEDMDGNIKSFREETGDSRSISYTFDDFFNRFGPDYYKNPKELKECYLENFENHITEALFRIATSFLSYCPIGEDYDKISGYKTCLRSAKKDVDVDSLIEKRNENILSCIKSDLKYYFESGIYGETPEEETANLERVYEHIKWYWDFNKVKYKNFDIKKFIESKKPKYNREKNIEEIIKEVIDFVVNGECYFN